MSTEVRHLYSMQNLTRPSDEFIFHEDVEQFLEKATATTAVNYISTNKRIIKHIIEAAKKQVITNTKNILHWLKPIKEGGIAQIQKWRHNKLVHDVYPKNKKRKESSVVPCLMQPSLLG